MGNSRKQLAGWIIASIGILLYTLTPIVWMLSLSLKAGGDINNQRFLPTKPSLENYRTVFSTDLFTSALRNSIGISLLSTAFSVVVAMFVAYAIARLDFPGKRLILSVALAIAMFPVISLVGPLFNMWRAIGLFDTWPGLIIPYVSFTLPLSIWTLSAFFREIPWEMEQAAQVDGATPWQAFRKVIVPLAAPGVFTTAILAFFTGASQFQQPTAAIAAAAVVVTIPVVIVTLVFQRRIVAGLTAGAVKG